MGPRPDGRGKSLFNASFDILSSVNGAAARRPRKAGYRARADRAKRASMGPRPDGRGKRMPTTTKDGKLAASMGPRPDGRGKGASRQLRVPPMTASMGPRPDGRGKTLASRSALMAWKASMGPRPDGRGKTRPRRAGHARSQRQWGRGQTAAESGRRVVRVIPEISVNGAAARRPRKVSTVQTREDAMGRQWGRGQTAAERFGICTKPVFAYRASMGPRPDGRGK